MAVCVVKFKPSILSSCSIIDLPKYINTVEFMELKIEDPQISFLNVSLKQRRHIANFVYFFMLFPDISTGAILMAFYPYESHF